VKNCAIFSVLVFVSDGRAVLKRALGVLKSVGDIEGLSSVYSVRRHPRPLQSAHNITVPDRFMGLVVAVKIQTDIAPLELMERVRRKLTDRESRLAMAQTEVELLVYGREHVMSPQITLPHPDLHVLPELAVPASEVWGDHVHAVLEENMTSIAKRFAGSDWGEFHSQGRDLL
jgi:7,8-dihydro-6-hydroxymethylpterin-pyrophosphokinase